MTYLDDLAPVLLLESPFEFELFAEWIAGLFKSALFVEAIVSLVSYFLITKGFFISGFLKRVVAEVAFERTGFYFFFESFFSVLFI